MQTEHNVDDNVLLYDVAFNVSATMVIDNYILSYT